MPDEKKQGLLKKRREAYKRKKDSNVLPNVKNPHCINFEDNQPSSSHATQSSQTCPVQLNGTSWFYTSTKSNKVKQYMLAVFLLTNDLTPPTDEFHHQMQSQCTHDTPKPESRTLIIEKKGQLTGRIMQI